MARLPVTESLHFFELTTEHAADLFALNNDPEVIRYTGDPPFKSVGHARQFIAAYDHYRTHGFGRWGLQTHKRAFIGWCGLKRHDAGWVDLGFRLKRSEWNKGFATEASLATLQFAFHRLRLNEVIGRAMKENAASIRVLEKVGMHCIRSESTDLHNALVYQVNKSTFLSHVTAEPPRII